MSARFKILLCACAVVLVLPRVEAADAACVPQACLQLDDPLERVACYDRAFGRQEAGKTKASAGAPVGPGVEAGSVAGAAKATEAADDFGLSGQAKLERDGRTPLESISATATQVSRSSAGRIVVTLDNGQVWMQADPNDDMQVKAGDRVTVKRGAIGSFRLAVPKRGEMRATRIK